jgi:hypothetical protein
MRLLCLLPTRRAGEALRLRPLAESARRAAVAAGSRAQGRPDAAGRLADAVLAAARQSRAAPRRRGGSAPLAALSARAADPRDALRARLGVSSQAASELLRQLLPA